MASEVTGNMLEMFAVANGLRIMAHRNADEWAAKINRNNGLCPCGKECPCYDCTCKFYEKDETGEQKMYNVDELGNSITVLGKIKEELSGVNMENKENTISTIEKAAKEIKEDAEKHNCEMCKEFMGGLGRKIGFLRRECEEDGGGIACQMELEDTVNRIDTMKKIFENADKVVGKENEIQEPQEQTDENRENQWESGDKNEEEKEPVKEKKVTGYSEFHDCVSETSMREDLSHIKKSDRWCIAAKHCGKGRLHIEEAMAACTEKKGGE